MNEHSESDLNEMQTRRAVLATAGGLLLPAGLLALDGEDAEATKRAKRRRRRRRKQVGVWANDVVVNFRNATSKTVEYAFSSTGSRTQFVALGPDKESGFAAGMKPVDLTTDAYLFISPGVDSTDGKRQTYLVWCENHEIGTPDVRIRWFDGSDRHDISGEQDMEENSKFEIIHRGFRFEVHRWTNGKEPLDDYDERYTRFFVTLSEA
jgi:hypothetical protein